MTSHDNVLSITLDILLEGLVDTTTLASISVDRMTMDSRQVMSGDMFIAVPGLTADGRDYIRDAIEAGAKAVIWEPEQGSVPIPIAWRGSSSGNRVPVIAIDRLSK